MDNTQNAAEVSGATSVDIGELVNVTRASGISLDGYDPAAFFTNGSLSTVT